MSGDQYTQVRRPVSRIAEKVLGWLSWIFLLLLTIITMFIALVSFSSDTSIQRLETSLNGNDFIQQILANNSLNTTQFVIWLQNGIWAVIVYFIICLLVSFLALISMNIRILSGILFLVASVITLPLVFLFVPLIIPILFFITAIMMFARKDKVETVPGYYADEPYDAYERYERPERQTNEGHYSEPVEPVREEPQSNTGTTQEQQGSADNQLRRGGYSSDVAQKVNASNGDSEEEPAVLSRQAKYNYKNKKQQDDFGDVSSVYDEEGNAVNDNTAHKEEDEMTREQQEALERERQQREAEEAQRRQAEYEEQQRLKYEEAQRKQREKQERAEEKARIKQEKKERKQREKERRKQMPSAANQRRMNFEERKKMTSHDEKQQKAERSVEDGSQSQEKEK